MVLRRGADGATETADTVGAARTRSEQEALTPSYSQCMAVRQPSSPRARRAPLPCGTRTRPSTSPR